MHRPLFFIICTDDENEAYNMAIEKLDSLTESYEIDWYQGIKESKRWSELEQYESVDFDKVKTELERLVKSTEKESKKWIMQGIKEFEKNMLNDALTSFRLATSSTSSYVFDLSDWSYDFVHTLDDLNKVIKYIENKKTMVVGFDVHY